MATYFDNFEVISYVFAIEANTIAVSLTTTFSARKIFQQNFLDMSDVKGKRGMTLRQVSCLGYQLCAMHEADMLHYKIFHGINYELAYAA